MNGYSPSDNLKLPGLAAVSGIVTNQVISKEFWITAGGSKNLVVRVKVSGVTQVGTLTLKLQTAMDDQYENSKTATFTANGYVYIKIQQADSNDQQYTPLLSKGQIVLTTTNAGDAVTVDSVKVLQEN